MAQGKIMIVRHAEKPGNYPTETGVAFEGVNLAGQADPESLVTLGWERAGGLVSLLAPSDNHFKSPALASPTVVYAADPNEKPSKADDPSRRPFQTISALATQLGITPNTGFKKKDYPVMVTDALNRAHGGDVVLVSWQHQDILSKSGNDSIVTEILKQTDTNPSNLKIPEGRGRETVTTSSSTSTRPERSVRSPRFRNFSWPEIRSRRFLDGDRRAFG